MSDEPRDEDGPTGDEPVREATDQVQDGASGNERVREPAEDVRDGATGPAARDTDSGGDRATAYLAHLVREVVHGQSILVTALALFTALVVGGVLIVLSDADAREPLTYFFSRPTDFLGAAWSAVTDAYLAIFRGALVGTGPWSETLVSTTPLIFAGLAFALPFRALIINIGGEGQFVAGAIVGVLVGFSLTGLPLLIHLPLAIAAGFAGGAFYGWIPGILKARTGAHEVIVTIMLNNVIILLLDWLLQTTLFQRTGRSDPVSKAVLDSAILPNLFGSTYRAHMGLLVALLAAFAAWWLMERTTYGLEVRAVGHNARAAQFAGMRPSRVQWSILLIGGAMAGMGGFSQVAGLAPHRLTHGISAGLGFDGITVALLGRSHPAGIVAASLLFGALRAGGRQMQVVTGTSLDLVTVIQAMVVLFIAAPAMIRALYRVRTPDRGLEASAGWST